jgi:MFS family permease
VLLTARAVGMVILTGLTVLALKRVGYRIPMFVGFLVISVGMLMLAIPVHGIAPYLWLSIGACVSGLGMGITIPAANNAALMLAPGQVSSISGLRGMFRQSGGIVSVSIATTLAARSGHVGAALGSMFVVFATVLFCALPLIFLVPRPPSGGSMER